MEITQKQFEEIVAKILGKRNDIYLTNDRDSQKIIEILEPYCYKEDWMKKKKGMVNLKKLNELCKVCRIQELVALVQDNIFTGWNLVGILDMEENLAKMGIAIPPVKENAIQKPSE